MYLKQIDKYYTHPSYKTDFRLSFSKDNTTRHFIIEYDGFEFHFKNRDIVNENNWEHFYTESDLERQYNLERYGFEFIRLNKFNCKKNPIDYIDHVFEKLVKKKI